MNKRQQAISILTQSRDLLAEQLIERIVDDEDQFISDAQGNSYMNEISIIYDDVCGKLNQVNSMIANLPPDSGPSQSAVSAGENGSDDEANDGEETEASKVNFGLFGRQVVTNDMAGAGATLSQLMGIDEELGLQSANSFRDKLEKDPQTMQKAMGLYGEMAAGNNNASLVILWQCFGLQGLPAVQALESLKASQFGK